MGIGFPNQPGGGPPGYGGPGGYGGGYGGGGYGGGGYGGGPGGYAPPPPYQPPPGANLVAAPPAPAPRAVPLSAVGWNAGFMMMFGAGFGGIPFLVFIIFTLTMVMPHEDWILDYRGEQATAQPSGARPTNTSVNERTVYDIDVSYKDKQGRARRASVSTLNPSVIAAANAKTPLKIEYDPEEPSRARVVGEDASAIGFMAFMPLGFSFIGIPLFFAGFAGAVRRRSLYRRGTPAQARVQQVTASASTQNNQRVMIAHYSYQTPSGMSQGELKTVSPPKVGSVIWVLFDPKNPARSIAA